MHLLDLQLVTLCQHLVHVLVGGPAPCQEEVAKAAPLPACPTVLCTLPSLLDFPSRTENYLLLPREVHNAYMHLVFSSSAVRKVIPVTAGVLYSSVPSEGWHDGWHEGCQALRCEFSLQDTQWKEGPAPTSCLWPVHVCHGTCVPLSES